jgi:hypothetical protein
LHTLDGVAIGIKQMADTTEQIHVLRPVITSPPAPFQRLYLGEFAFPKAQNMLRHLKIRRDFADGAKRARRFRPAAALGRALGRTLGWVVCSFGH